MRLVEFNDTGTAVLGLITHLRSRAGNNDTISVRTPSFLRMLSNIGIKTDVAGLERLKSTNKILGRYLGDMTDQFVTVNLASEPEMGMDDFEFDMGPGEEDFGDFEDPMGADGFDTQDPMAGDPMAEPQPADDFAGMDGSPAGMDIATGTAGQAQISSMAKRAAARRR